MNPTNPISSLIKLIRKERKDSLPSETPLQTKHNQNNRWILFTVPQTNYCFCIIYALEESGRGHCTDFSRRVTLGITDVAFLSHFSYISLKMQKSYSPQFIFSHCLGCLFRHLHLLRTL